MFSDNKLNMITSSAAKQAKILLNEKLDAVILYGSYARGDHDDESDVDILLLINGSDTSVREYRNPIADISSALSLENDITVSILPCSTETFNKYKNSMPFLKNILKNNLLSMCELNSYKLSLEDIEGGNQNCGMKVQLNYPKCY